MACPNSCRNGFTPVSAKLWRLCNWPGHAFVSEAKPVTTGDDNYVAWLRWSGDEPARYLVLCDSDSPGAFRVYRHPAQPPTYPLTRDAGALMVRKPADFNRLPPLGIGLYEEAVKRQNDADAAGQMNQGVPKEFHAPFRLERRAVLSSESSARQMFEQYCRDGIRPKMYDLTKTASGEYVSCFTEWAWKIYWKGINDSAGAF
jgi:hypothetical protein